MTDEPNDPLAHINPVLRSAVESITVGMAQAFDQVWTRPDAAELIEGFLAERIVFQIDRTGIIIAEKPQDPPADPPCGQYL